MSLRRRSRTDGPDDPTQAIRAAITAITSARATAERNAATALVNQAQVGSAVARQRDELNRAREDVTAAIDAASRVADDALATDGEVAAAPYQQHVAGLRTQREVLDLGIAQLDELGTVSGEHVERARTLLVTSRRDLDAALREQLRLLVAVERLDRARLVAAARARIRGIGQN